MDLEVVGGTIDWHVPFWWLWWRLMNCCSFSFASELCCAESWNSVFTIPRKHKVFFIFFIILRLRRTPDPRNVFHWRIKSWTRSDEIRQRIWASDHPTAPTKRIIQKSATSSKRFVWLFQHSHFIHSFIPLKLDLKKLNTNGLSLITITNFWASFSPF